ncbi:MAG TPA: GNAT family N-acetyltransferase [Ktedonobacterales bacterium]|nr:GNAT family N-acetyltransferase [Ktedonobacterales bacterium]
MRTSIRLQPLQPATHYPRLAELRSAAKPEPITVEQLQEWEAQAPQGQLRRHQVAVDEQGQIIGYNDAGRDPWMPPGLFDVEVLVDPTWCRQGIGALLYQDALQFCQAQGATRLQGMLRDNCPPCLRFAEQRGFRIERHRFESTLDLDAFDERRFAGHIEAIEASGIHFFTLADLGNTKEAQRRLHSLNERINRDTPGYQSWLTFEAFQTQICGASWFRPDGQIVAADGENWIGMAAVGFFANTQSMYNMFTGVDRAYRGRGIALALKLLTIRCARAYNARYVRTHNDSENAPMLAVNRKLGYRPEPGLYRVALDLR